MHAAKLGSAPERMGMSRCLAVPPTHSIFTVSWQQVVNLGLVHMHVMWCTESPA